MQGQQQAGISSELETKKRELMDAHSTIKNIKDRLDRIENENIKLKSDNEILKKKLDTEKEGLEDLIEFHKNEKETLREEKQKLDFEHNILKRKMDDIEEHYRKLLDLKNKEQEAEKLELNDQIKLLNGRIENMDNFVAKKQEIENERRQLVEALEKEKKDKLRELADKDREKVQATDMLKKDMLHRIQETKTSLLALKKEQLETTTRLTVLQNHQLTTELEYQSKQTEKLLFKNSKLQEQVTSLKRDIEIHKQVEQELAKRSHFSQKLIKKLSARVKELEDAQEQQSLQDEPKDESIKKDPGNLEEIIRQLEAKIQQLERKLAKQNNDNDILRNENYNLQTKLDAIRLDESKYQNLAALVAGNLGQIQTSPDLNFDDLDVTELREKSVNEWSQQQRVQVMNVLMNQIRQHLNRKSFHESKNMTFDEKNKSINLPSKSKPQFQELQQETYPDESQNESQKPSKRFQGVPLDISSQIVKSNLRDWGKPANTVAGNQLQRKFKVKPL